MGEDIHGEDKKEKDIEPKLGITQRSKRKWKGDDLMKEIGLKDASERESIEKAKQYVEELIRMHINSDFCYMEVDNKLLHIVLKILSESKIPRDEIEKIKMELYIRYTCGVLEDTIEFIEENNYKYINFNEITYFIKRTKDKIANLRNIHSISLDEINNAKSLFEETINKYKELRANKENLMREGKRGFWKYFSIILPIGGISLGIIGVVSNITPLSLGGYIAAWIVFCFYATKFILHDIKAIRDTEIEEMWEDL